MLIFTSRIRPALSFNGVPCHFSRSSILIKPFPLYVFAKIAVGFPFVIEASWNAYVVYYEKSYKY